MSRFVKVGGGCPVSVTSSADIDVHTYMHTRHASGCTGTVSQADYQQHAYGTDTLFQTWASPGRACLHAEVREVEREE